MSDKVYKPGDVIPVGYEGEENARTAYIDIAELREMWPQAAPALMVVRPKESVPYPAAIADEGDRIAWTIRAEDAAITGHGSYQVLMRDSEGGILGKSTIGATMIKTSLPGSTGETPEAAKSWVSEVLDAAKRAEDAAERAENAGGETGGVSEDAVFDLLNKWGVIQSLQDSDGAYITDDDGAVLTYERDISEEIFAVLQRFGLIHSIVDGDGSNVADYDNAVLIYDK